ncbi:hypothetical protein RN001_003004 [Aquatica leii]|uniref:Uncharacterized protein n=1 Tax=Aquatica leii TaxID=1421715 RepID=A0AAN7PI02_9COLE|nr:hypothetical protein RN001_003004 [Aquatica leii]
MIAAAFIVVGILAISAISKAGLVTHEYSNNQYPKATSYQNFHMEHFHAVPTYAKKEFKHLLENPISVGKSVSNVNIHHGDKHDHGYAVADNNYVVHENSFEKGDSANREPPQLLLNEEYSHSNTYDSDDNTQEVASEEHQELDQDQALLPQHVVQHPYKYNAIEYHGGSVGHGLGHYQPVMYVLQYQNQNDEKAVYEHQN